MDTQSQEFLTGLTAPADQAQAALASVAVLAGSYMKELVRQGFSRQEAHKLVLQYVAHMFAAPRPPQNGTEP